MSASNVGQGSSTEHEEGLLLRALSGLFYNETCTLTLDRCLCRGQGSFSTRNDLNLSFHSHEVENGICLLAGFCSLVCTVGETGISLTREVTAHDTTDVARCAEHLMDELE